MEDLFAKEYGESDNSFYDAETNSIQWIDINSWKRKRLFYNYLGTDFPYIVITANVDVTKPLAFAHKHGISFNLVMVYLCNQTVDSIENYRYRFIDGKPFVIDHTRPTVNHIKKGEEITPENVRSIRPSNGLSPICYKDVIGKKAAEDITFGEPILWEKIER